MNATTPRSIAAGTIRLVRGVLTAAFTWIAVIGATAQAGDRAQSHVIGFSPDGRYVAFEQFGTADGTGYPYAMIDILDTVAMEPLYEESFLVRIDEQQMTLDEMGTVGVAAAREQAVIEAEAVMTELGIVQGNTGTTLIHHPYSDLGAPPREVRFSIGAAFSPYLNDENVIRATLSPITADICVGLAIDEIYLLTVELVQQGGQATVMRREDALPETRFCPTDYRIHDIVVYALDQLDQTDSADRYAMLVILAVEESPGFEGPDYRYVGAAATIDYVRR